MGCIVKQEEALQEKHLPTESDSALTAMAHMRMMASTATMTQNSSVVSTSLRA
jgi:GTP cyclohydrolase III